MDKLSYYNVVVPYGAYKLVYNTLTNSLVCLTADEHTVMSGYTDNLDGFSHDYPSLYDSFKKAGFIVDGDFDELAYIRLQNNKVVYEDQRYHVTINPTLDCNLRCWYCSTEYAKAQHKGCMTAETIEAVKAHLAYLVEKKRITALHLDWFGGEPLMYFDGIVDPVSSVANELVSKHGIAFTQHVTTNSVFMTEEMMQRMAELHFTSFQIPLDGNERHHNVIKRQADKSGTFKAIVCNINKLPEMIPDAHIILRINFDKQTLRGIEDVIPLFTENAKQHITVDFQKVWQIKCNEDDLERLRMVRKAFTDNGFCADFWVFTPRMFHRCYADRLHHYIINYDGRVFKCTAQDYGNDKVLGRLEQDGHIEWNDKLRSSLFSHPTFDNERCLACKLLPICMGPCIAKCKEARDKGFPMPCVVENSQSTVEEFVVSEACRRKLLNG